MAQRIGFTKILKKYKRWTKDRELSQVFKEEISNQPDSLFQLDLSYLLDQYIEVLGALRSVFEADGTTTASSDSTSARSSAARISRSLEKGEQIDFDVTLATVPMGSNGNKATYWVHPDHIVEVQVLLLQQMRLYTGGPRSATRNGSIRPTPNRRHSSTANIDKHFGNEDDVALVVLDHAEAFAIKQNASTIGSSEETQGNTGTKAAGHVRCVASGSAAVVLCTGADAQPAQIKTAKLERKALQDFLDSSAEYKIFQRRDSHKGKENGSSIDDPTAIRQWLKEHKSTKPIAGAVSKRTRFIGLHNNYTGGIWATLDRDVFLKDSLHKDLEREDWVTAARSHSATFPHAILEVRREGNHAASLIQALDRSYLVERVRGFSLEAHAVWICCKPSVMSAPLWIPLLEKDIRKLPELVRRRSRKTRCSTTDSPTQSSPPHTSTSNTSYDGQSSPLASRNGESSVTSAQEYVDPPTLQAFRKKHRRPYADYPPPIARADTEPEVQQRYWNEYDHPEDEETGYYIYIDPNAIVKFPGQELFEAWAKKTREIFGIQTTKERASFSTHSDASTDDENETVDESPITGAAANYGTIASNRQTQHDSYFGTLFGSLRDPRHDIDIIHERRSLLGELEIRQHKTEMTKLRFYLTCLATAIVIDIILGLMIVTSRRKERGVVDAVVLFGTIVTLILCIVAVLSMRTRRERLGWVHQGAVTCIAGSVVALDILLLLWVMRV